MSEKLVRRFEGWAQGGASGRRAVFPFDIL